VATLILTPHQHRESNLPTGRENKNIMSKKIKNLKEERAYARAYYYRNREKILKRMSIRRKKNYAINPEYRRKKLELSKKYTDKIFKNPFKRKKYYKKRNLKQRKKYAEDEKYRNDMIKRATDWARRNSKKRNKQRREKREQNKKLWYKIFKFFK
jgi:hypothetical protein